MRIVELHPNYENIFSVLEQSAAFPSLWQMELNKAVQYKSAEFLSADEML